VSSASRFAIGFALAMGVGLGTLVAQADAKRPEAKDAPTTDATQSAPPSTQDNKAESPTEAEAKQARTATPRKITPPLASAAHSATPPPRPAPSSTPGAGVLSQLWQERWSEPVGSTEGDKLPIGIGQIAVRGPLIAVASRGLAGKTDALDGVHILDGRSRSPGDSGSRRVRIIASPRQSGMAETKKVSV